MSPILLTVPLEHVSTIPVKTLSELDMEYFYNNLIQGLYLLATRHQNDTDLNKDTKKYLKEVYTHCSKKAFQKKLALKANTVLKEDEEYLNDIKIKEAKKRTAQEAELLGVDMTHISIKQYRSEVLIDVSNASQSEQAKSSSSSSHQTSISRTQHESNEPSEKA